MQPEGVAELDREGQLDEDSGMADSSPILGRWRITRMDLWDQDYVDAEVEGYLRFDRGGSGEFQFGYVHGWMTLDETERDGRPAIEWSWEGNDEMDPASGRGWAVVEADGTLKGKLYFHSGDKSGFTATRTAGPREEASPRMRIIPVAKQETPTDPPPVDWERHRRLRAILRRHQNAVVETISRTALQRAAKEFGLLKGNKLLLETEDELTSLTT